MIDSETEKASESLTEDSACHKDIWMERSVVLQREKERKEGGSERDCSLLDLIVAHQPGRISAVPEERVRVIRALPSPYTNARISAPRTSNQKIMGSNAARSVPIISWHCQHSAIWCLIWTQQILKIEPGINLIQPHLSFIHKPFEVCVCVSRQNIIKEDGPAGCKFVCVCLPENNN